MRRVRQLVRALNANITEQDMVCLAKWLTPDERALFDQMSVADRKHCLNVADTALKLAEMQSDINKEVLAKAALLHDIGRGGGTVGTVHKVIFVVAKALFGNAINRFACPEKKGIASNLRNALYISQNHPEIGAKRLLLLGTSADVVNLVKNHHQSDTVDSPPELVLLKRADEAN